MSHCCEDHADHPDQPETTNPGEAEMQEQPVLAVEETPTEKPAAPKNPWLVVSVLIGGILLFNNYYAIQLTPKNGIDSRANSTTPTNTTNPIDTSVLAASVLPEEGVVLPITWGDLGKQMVKEGVIDEDKFTALFQDGLTDEQQAILSGTWNEPIVLNNSNSRFLLDVLWAFGLANKNDILETGEMMQNGIESAGRFASTGGWSLSTGNPMDHYSAHAFVTLTPEQQALVDEVSRNVYRPCCGNNTHFPDCNHGMAMLGLLELMAAQGATEQEMYDVALQVNSYWFPQIYLTLAQYFEEQGLSWDEVDAKTVLGAEYSSSKGYMAAKSRIQSLPQSQQGGTSC